MSLYLVLPVIEFIFCVALISLLIIKGRHDVARVPFGLYLGFMAAWGIFIFLMRAAPDLSQAAFWEKFVFGAILSAAVTFYWFTSAITGSRISMKILVVLLVAAVTVIAFIPTGLIFSGMQQMWYGKAPVIAPLFPLYVSTHTKGRITYRTAQRGSYGLAKPTPR